MIQRLLILVLLIGAAVFSAWLLNWLSADAGSAVQADAQAPDYYMEDFTTLTMDRDGKPKNKLSADYMAHYPHDNSTELVRPRMEIFRADELPLYIDAEKGRVEGDDDTISLYGIVKMREYDAHGEPLLEVSTTDVKVLLEQEYAETDSHATIVTGTAVITGRGMRVYLPENRLEIIDHEKTILN
ncbi:MAG: LPS export ABC transporter periplasmic protein LptC [Gammaproteobacteria bacterium]|nr:LPS export ABC transporter periplasmic protein LptC [Gammaproteobacteria bacterium]MCY4210032.1 LPS export ABC transporter periplasmic protein LptC [Gammaproteobacteria bacterium]MCY4281452.1 LPS export ABC transporter periplasmic protein LptC [Gammaproteobacteria bacterium]MCY4339545.1 LPS export ABC transporter periplasmic protein LptC [Gammaproteobacteria bacterium]